MARLSKGVKLYQDIQQSPELRSINAEVNQINDIITKMGRSEYFKGISLPEQMNKYTLIESAKIDYSAVKGYLDAIKGSLTNIWNVRRSESALSSQTGIVKSGNEFIRILSIAPESSIKRSKKSGRGVLSEKATRILLADDITMLKRLTHKSESEIMKFLNLWYESIEVSGGQLLSDFVDSVYRREYAGQGASQSWGSPPVKMIIEEQILSTFGIEPNFDDGDVSYDTESKMGSELYDAWMNLFS